MKTRMYFLIILFLVILIISTSCDVLQSNTGDNIEASGVIEASEVVVAPEVSGRIIEIWAKEADQISFGDPLFQIEDELLASQLRQAESALNVAQANYDLVAAGMMDEEQQAAIAAAETGSGHLDVRVVPNPHLALRAARDAAGENDLVLATGSVYLAGIARDVWGTATKQPVVVSRRSASKHAEGGG